MKKMNKKAFTLIELLVVIAVVGILVLLGAPKLTGYTQKAELTRIQHDVKVMEQEVGTVLINNDDDFNKWEDNSKNFNQLIQENELFEKEGPVAEGVEPIDGSYKVIPKKYKDKINTKLKGTFYANSGGKVYYEHVKPLLGIPTEPEENPGYSDEEIDYLIKEGYIPVATADELNNVRSATLETYGEGTKWVGKYPGGLDKQYVQVADIDLSGYSKEGWTPIGTDSSRFTGTYDGGNYVIRNLYVNGDGKDEQGLFGFISVATISNVGLIGNTVTGSGDVGGLVGRAYWQVTIINSYATGSVTGKDNVGGLVGNAGWSTTISNSYATGSVTGKGLWVGGLVGNANPSATISNSYATGSVTGRDIVGGLVGYARQSTIKNSYATGLVDGSEGNVGGLVGAASTTTISNSYWDKDTTLQTSSAAGGIGKSTEKMKDKDTYSGWDFEETWKIDEGDYPKLK